MFSHRNECYDDLMSKIPWGQLSIGLGLAFQFLATLGGTAILGLIADTVWKSLAPWGIISAIVGGFILATKQLLTGIHLMDDVIEGRNRHGRNRT